jgi:hypothetical protein
VLGHQRRGPFHRNRCFHLARIVACEREKRADAIGNLFLVHHAALLQSLAGARRQPQRQQRVEGHRLVRPDLDRVGPVVGTDVGNGDRLGLGLDAGRFFVFQADVLAVERLRPARSIPFNSCHSACST